MTEHTLKVKELKGEKKRTGECSCGGWDHCEPTAIKPDQSTLNQNFDLHVQLNKNRGNA